MFFISFYLTNMTIDFFGIGNYSQIEYLLNSRTLEKLCLTLILISLQHCIAYSTLNLSTLTL